MDQRRHPCDEATAGLERLRPKRLSLQPTRHLSLFDFTLVFVPTLCEEISTPFHSVSLAYCISLI